MPAYPSGRRGGAWLIVAAAAVVFAQIALAVVRNSLWLDESLTMSFAYNSPGGIRHWLRVLSSAEDPHFPTIHLVTRAVMQPVSWLAVPLEVAVRAPMVLLVAASLVLTLHLCLQEEDRLRGCLLALGVLLALVADRGWPEHSAEARMYGLLSALGLAMVMAIHRDRFMLAAGCGLAIVALHPFGLMIGLAPVAMALLFRRRSLGGTRHAALAATTAAVLGLVAYWSLQKFAGGRSQSFAVHGHSDAIMRVLAALNWPALGAAIVLVAVAAAVAWRRRPAALPRVGALALILLSLCGFVLCLLVLRPETPPYVRYVTWANPVLVGICLAAACSIADGLRIVPPRGAMGLAAGGLCLAVMAVAVTRPFGPPWGNGLREAARYLNAVVGDDAAVAPDTFEMIFIAPRYRRGFRCERGAQITAYLSPAVQARAPCQVANDVPFGPEVQRVYVVREPLAWVGPRRPALEGFTRSEVHRFHNVSVEVFDRTGR